MNKVLSGKEVADALYQRLSSEIPKLGQIPRIVFVRVGEDPASQTYVRMKAKRAEDLGLRSETLVFPENVAQAELCGSIAALNEDPEVHGILVQLPLPGHLDKAAVLDTIDPMKDVDGLHPVSMGLLMAGRPRFVACTPGGIVELLRHYGIEREGKRVVVVGRSDIVGKPMAQLMVSENATVTLCHSRTRNLAEETRRAEILIVAAGRHHLIGPEHVGEGAVVIDVGMHRVNGKLAGDVNYEAVAPKTSAITPVPGGVGPMTIAMLMHNLVQAARLRKD